MNDAKFDSGGAMAVHPTFITVSIPLGPVEPFECGVDQPQGMTCGELLSEAQFRLRDLLTSQHAGHAIQELNTPENLAHEIQLTLRAIQRYSATPMERTLA